MQIDYDELISIKPNAIPDIPLPTLRDFLQVYDAKHPDAAFYMFYNVFFPMQEPDAHNSTGSLTALKKVRHTAYERLGRMKCIYKPRRMDVLYTHGGLPARQIFKAIHVNETTATLNHYRSGVTGATVGSDYTLLNLYTNAILNNRFYKHTTGLHHAEMLQGEKAAHNEHKT